MMSSVPQFIDVEDKIAGPLTWKQLGWMMGMGATMLVFFMLLDKIVAIILAIPTALLFAALAFYKPNGLPLTSFLGHSVLFMFRPKIAVWERPIPQMTSMKPSTDLEKRKDTAPPISKGIDRDKLRELARIIDSRQ